MDINDLILEITKLCDNEKGGRPYDNDSTFSWKDGKEDMADDIMSLIRKFKKLS